MFYFLGSIVNFSQDSDVHFKYIQVSLIFSAAFKLNCILCISGSLQDRPDEGSGKDLPREQLLRARASKKLPQGKITYIIHGSSK